MRRDSGKPLRPVPFTQVKIQDLFWAPRQQTNARATIPAVYRWLQRSGRIDAWRLTWKPGDPNPPHIFWDSDVAKWLEAAAYAWASSRSYPLKRPMDEVVELITRAQQPDGYLNTHFTAVEPDKRWTNLRDDHELYCAGHLMEAAVAHFRATGQRRLLDALCRYADYIASVFGPAPGQKRGYCGHPEIELALVKLYRTTGVRRYLDLARFFIEERGRTPHYFDLEAAARGENPTPRGRWGYEYYQAHRPVREQTTAEGHAVRAAYLYSGVADLAAETGDEQLRAVCARLWQNIVRRRMYITGGIGSAHDGERFTFDYDLPNETAYAETCAAIGLVFLSHRLLQMEADARYADVMERALYNGVLSAISLNGRAFFYVNPLAQHPRAFRYHHWVTERQAWFGCACCPPNVARLLASLGDYVYSTSEDGLWVHLYAGGSVSTEVAGTPLELVQETDYPWEGLVRLTVNPGQATTFTLALRIPGWCRGASVQVNRRPVRAVKRKGYALLNRTWRPGDEVDLALPMPVEKIEAHPRVRQDAGRVALQRGPVVYCLEEADNGRDLHDLVLLPDAPLEARYDPGLLGGVTVVTGKAFRRNTEAWKGELYRPAGSPRRTISIQAVPYACWANRKPGEMIVWIHHA